MLCRSIESAREVSLALSRLVRGCSRRKSRGSLWWGRDWHIYECGKCGWREFFRNIQEWRLRSMQGPGRGNVRLGGLQAGVLLVGITRWQGFRGRQTLLRCPQGTKNVVWWGNLAFVSLTRRVPRRVLLSYKSRSHLVLLPVAVLLVINTSKRCYGSIHARFCS